MTLNKNAYVAPTSIAGSLEAAAVIAESAPDLSSPEVAAKDAADLRAVATLVLDGKYLAAYHKLDSLDTIVRESVPEPTFFGLVALSRAARKPNRDEPATARRRFFVDGPRTSKTAATAFYGPLGFVNAKVTLAGADEVSIEIRARRDEDGNFEFVDVALDSNAHAPKILVAAAKIGADLAETIDRGFDPFVCGWTEIDEDRYFDIAGF